jgi:hypothetical protein
MPEAIIRTTTRPQDDKFDNSFHTLKANWWAFRTWVRGTGRGMWTRALRRKMKVSGGRRCMTPC